MTTPESAAFEEAYRHCRAIFDGWCSRTGYDDPTDATQVALAAWQASNFDDTSDLHMVAGLTEEVGELHEAIEDRDPGAVIDAFGDVLIYLGQLLTSNRIAMRPLLGLRRNDGRTEIAVPLGQLAHAVLKHGQKIRGLADVETYRRALVNHAGGVIATTRAVVDVAVDRLPLRADGVYRMVGAQVLARDWRRDPITGLDVAAAPPVVSAP